MEWEYISLSEPRVVARLILHRGKIDTDGMSDMDEPVRCIYIDLDRLVERSELDGREEVTVTMLMLGYASADIAEMLGSAESDIKSAFRQAVRKIVRCNNAIWRQVYDVGVQSASVV